jgi:rubrerythrin
MADSPKFTKNKENFICGNCATEVIGDGYTNHCPKCLYSKHVDINPGDRRAMCNGMMQPVSIEIKHGQKRILHKCLKCGYEKTNKIAPADSQQEILKLFGP